MSLPGNGIFVVQCEMNMLVTAMRRSTRWGSHSFPNDEYDVLMRAFQDLKCILNNVEDLKLLDPATYLSPFLEVIRSKETTGPVTNLALSAVNKFLSYGLIDPTHPSVPATVEDIADAVTHARFVGTDHSADGIVLTNILQVLRTLMLSPEGAMLTDESVCEIMLTCFRIFFETRLIELLRRHAEQCLRDMTQLIFMRLPQFAQEDMTTQTVFASGGLSLKKRDKTSKKKGTSLERASSLTEQTSAASDTKPEVKANKNLHLSKSKNNIINEAEIIIEPSDEPDEEDEDYKKHGRHSSMDLAANGNTSITQLLEKCVNNTESLTTDDIKMEEIEPLVKNDIENGDLEVIENKEELVDKELLVKVAEKEKLVEYVNHRGIRFTPQSEGVNLQPYGLSSVKELFKFLISLCNPLDEQNTPSMIYLGLCLLGTTLEVSSDHLAAYPSLLYLVKDPLCRNLLNLLSTEKISIFALDLQVSFLLFESMRVHLKYQIEAYFRKLHEIISMDTTKVLRLKEIHHIALESLAQMFRIPGLCTELYLNYDCDIYCTNIFEELTKLLSKNVVSSSASNVHFLSLEALMVIIEAIENASQKPSDSQVALEDGREEYKYGRGGHVSLEMGGMEDSVNSDHVSCDISQFMTLEKVGRHKPEGQLPTEAELDNIKNTKKWIATGTEMFNQKPERGIEYLQEHGVLSNPLDPHQVALFLRENPDLDKKMIGDYICKRSSGETEDGYRVLTAFARSFDFAGLRIDSALRLYLETFRLPGEAPLIFLVMEKFAEQWHTTNGEPFANTDAAFRLAYAVIMLNMDQHNHNAKKLNIPMNVEDFVRNLRGLNGNEDFQQSMLEEIYHSIKGEEMVMPAERLGVVRDAYLWRVLQRRGVTARYLLAPKAAHRRLLAVVTPPAVAALSAAFERSTPPTQEEIKSNNTRDSVALLALNGLERCATLVARQHASSEHISVDTLLLTLCKFSGLLAPSYNNYIAIAKSLHYLLKDLGLPRSALGTFMDRVSKTALTGSYNIWLGREGIEHSEGSLNLLRGRKPGNTVFTPLPPNHAMDPAPARRIHGVSLGQSTKAQVSLRRVFSVCARLADSVRGAWTHVMDIIRTLYLGRLLPKNLVEAEDYLSPSGTVSLIREASRTSDAGLLSSLYSYIALGESAPRTPSMHEKALIDVAVETVVACNLYGLLVTETKFLHLDSLKELVRAMIVLGAPPDAESLQLNPQLEDITIFFLELLGQTLIQNRDRVLTVWSEAGAHIQAVVLWSESGRGSDRALTALLRIVARLMRSHHCASTVLGLAAMLLQLPHAFCLKYADIISCGLYELVKTSAQNVHSGSDWDIVFALLCAAGAGAWPRSASNPTSAASSRSEGSDDESDRRPTSASPDSELSQSPHTQGWIMVQNAGPTESELELSDVVFRGHKPGALVRCAEALALVVRDVAHVTPYNVKAAVRAVRVFAAAVFKTGKKKATKTKESRKSRSKRKETSDDEDEANDQYYLVSIQLLDLMHTLHSRTAQIFRWWREEADQNQGSEDYDLWEVAWMPLLQGIAQFCTDSRKQVSNSALAYLQRALLAPGLCGLSAARWEACFCYVLFPLLARLPNTGTAPARANTILCKVFLQHLSSLSSRSSFASLWGRVVDTQRRLLSPQDDALTEAARESLKNMLLVMDSVKIFSNEDGYTELWYKTWEQIGEFLPNLKDELFPEAKDTKQSSPIPSQLPQSSPPPTLVPLVLPSSLVSPAPTVPVSITAPIAVKPGSVPIRNPLYAQTGLTSSVLLQPLNQMVSTSLSITLPSTMPILLPTKMDTNVTTNYVTPIPSIQVPTYAIDTAIPNLKTDTKPTNYTSIQNTVIPNYTTDNYVLNLKENVPNNEVLPLPIINTEVPTYKNENTEVPTLSRQIKKPVEMQQSELYAEYLSNPYNDTQTISPKKPTLYEPTSIMDQTVPDQGSLQPISNVNLLLDLNEKKSSSMTSSPMHNKPIVQFSSTDNLKTEEASNMFNFSNYFGSVSNVIPPGSEIFDQFLPPQEG